MSAFVHAVERFFDHLAAVHWSFLAIAVLCHACRSVAVSRAWRNIVAASYPDTDVRWRHIYGAYVAGVGVNAIIPARAGDLAKLYIAKRRVAGSTYTTLASTQVALTMFDLAVASVLLIWALSAGVLPGADVLPSLPDFDFAWFFEHRALFANILLVAGVAAVLILAWAAHRIQGFKRRVAQGFAVLRDRRRYFGGVAFWQAIDWTLRLIALYWFLRAFGIPATFHTALLVQVTQSLSTVFPFSPGGVGTEQALILFVLAGEAARSSLLAFSVGMKLTVVAVNLAIGFGAIAIMLKTLRWRRLAEADKAAAAAAAKEQELAEEAHRV